MNGLGEKLSNKLTLMKQVNPRNKIFLCPILPSRDELLNLKILDSIAYIKETLIPNKSHITYVDMRDSMILLMILGFS